MPIYSFGKDSPIKFELTEEEADLYNCAATSFYEAQIHYKKEFGTDWDQARPMDLKLSEEDFHTFFGFVDTLKEAIERYGKPVTEDDFTNDFLTKN